MSLPQDLSQRDIYLDASATTPPRKEIVELISNIQLNSWGNSASIHNHGITAAEVVERSRNLIARNFNCDSQEIIFTSGATESVHLAILGSAINVTPGRIVLSSVEHPAVVSAAMSLCNIGWEVSLWPVDKFGMIRLDLIDKYLSPPTKIVSLIWGQAEVGTLQPVKLISDICRSNNILFHTDATQFISQGILNWRESNIELLTASSHKIQGPKGIGLLIKRRDSSYKLSSIQSGGLQEMNLRSGTLPTELIAGFSVALDTLNSGTNHNSFYNSEESINVRRLTKMLRNNLQSVNGILFTGHPTDRLPHHISFLLSDQNNLPIPGKHIVRELSRRGISVSSGSACHSGTLQESHVLIAMDIEKRWCKSGLRMSLGPWLNYDDILNVSSIMEDVLRNFKIR